MGGGGGGKVAVFPGTTERKKEKAVLEIIVIGACARKGLILLQPFPEAFPA